MTAPAEKGTIPRLALAGIFGGLFCGYLGLTAAIPVLPGFVRDSFGATDVAVGMVVMATALTALLVRPVSGHLADRYGHRLVMQLGALIVAVGGALYFLPLGLTGLIGVRLLLGVGEASLFTAGAVWVVSLAPHHRRGQLIGLYGVSMWGGISVGTFLGATLLPLGYGAVWGFSVAAALIGLALISLAPVSPRTEQPSGGHALLVRPALLPGAALALAAAGYAGLAAFVVLHLQARGIDSGVVVLSCFSAVYAGTRLFIGHLPDRLGPRRVATWSGVGEAAGLLIIALAPNLTVAVIGSLVMGAGFSLLHPSLALMVMNLTEASKQGAAIGAYTSFWDLGLSVWGPVIGAVATGFGYPAVFVAGAVCAAAAVAVALCVRQPATRPAVVS
ncbi:MFS transporter [Streptosporangium roseum]|uniref:Major facilitator transporter n=1 Tax=Streptosporangium roseum (strain ATCC 12428 / DSM 43021 / JCM 3005 / KCTC 9067 / NCIMB 10171 / NRRL 2505 / NI 9100) TaxID=479432 RepID=D2BAF3_STRRD|nr:MFS transporter [Streptosporangium roseum]ACZ87978.1 major facilitator transporter [Streptosporangium roseum DSM 43021]